ncbi:hypothetical protein BW14_08410 [Bifidobacterium sp. UTBIF-68]|nr:hypothetical protein BW14_08410 [Bifidobacterium sp. UTBIF-68]
MNRDAPFPGSHQRIDCRNEAADAGDAGTGRTGKEVLSSAHDIDWAEALNAGMPAGTDGPWKVSSDADGFRPAWHREP